MTQTPVTNLQASLTLTQYINYQGIFPPRGGGGVSGGYIGAIEISAGSGFLFGYQANGQLLSISQNTALFSLLGTQYGGNGTTNFALPNFNGVEMVGMGQGAGLQNLSDGQTLGENSNLLTTQQMPTGLGGSGLPIDNYQASMAITYCINPFGIFPSGGLSLDSIGVISAFAGNFAPGDALICNGQLLAISQYDALFQLIGTTYGGDGVTTFALPDLQGRDIVGSGNGFVLGQQVGSANVNLTNVNSPLGVDAAFNNQQPGLVMNYFMAMQGIYPSSPVNSTDTQTPYIGQIVAVAEDLPNVNGWVLCNGQLLSINQNQALFSILGTTYGGDGRVTFAVPDLRGRTVLGAGSGNILGTVNGSNTTTLTTSNLALPASPGIALTSDTGSSNSDKITSNGALSISAIVNGATVEYSINSGATWTSSFTAVEGSNTVWVRQTSFSLTSNPSTLTFTLDTTAPTAPTIALASDTGSSSSDKITSNGALTLTGLETGASAQYSTDGGATWTSSLTAVQGANSVMVRQIDVAGNISAASSAFTFTLDTVSPATPLVRLNSDTGASSTDKVTRDGSLILTGVESGATLQFSYDGGSTWTSTLSEVQGLNSIQIRQIDIAGNISGASAVFTFTLDTVAPTAPTVALTSDTGSSSADGITSNGALTLTGVETGASVQYSIDGGTTWTSSFTAVEGANSVQVRQIDVAGNISAASSAFAFTLDTAAPTAPTIALTTITGNSPLAVFTSNGALTLTGVETGASAQYSIDGGTTWTSSFTAVEGANSVMVRQIDVAGNISAASSTLAFTLDTIAPTAPSIALSSDTGSSSNDKITSNGALTLTSVETGASVQYSIDGGATWTSSFNAVEGANSVMVRQTDLAGNISAALAAFTFTLDTIAPTAPTIALASDTGASSADKITSNGALTLTSVETGASVQYSIDGGATWTSSFTAVEGANSVQVRQIDVAGNTSAASAAFTFTLDTVAPTAPTVALTSDTGSSGSDKVTSNGALTLISVETGASVQYSIDGGTTWTSSFTAVEGANSVQVRQIDVAGNVSAASSAFVFTLDTIAASAPTIALTSDTGVSSTDKITSNGALTLTGVETGASVQYSIDGGTTWTSSFTAVQGANSVQARQIDIAGNISAASATFTFTLDSIGGTAPTIALTSDTGSSSTDKITSNGALTLAGVETGASVQYSIDGGTTWTSSFTAVEGANSVQVRQIDIAGNISAASTAFTFTLDTTAAAAPTVALTFDTGVSSTDRITSNGALTLTGVESGASVQYSIDGGTTWTNSFTAIQGANSVRVRQIDLAGNISAASSAFAFTLDTAGPTPPVIALASDTGVSSTDKITSNGALTLTGVETGASVQYSIDGGTTWTSSFTAVEGANSVQVRQTDVAGNISAASSAFAFTLDTAAPTLSITSIGGATDHRLQTIAGTIGASDSGLTISIYDGNTLIGTATPALNGTWSASVRLLGPAGTHSVTVRATDAAGNSSASAPIVYTLTQTNVAFDFNGDGTSDTVLQSGGTIIDWVFSNGAMQTAFAIDNLPTTWSVVGAGDVNGDGAGDILLQSGSTLVAYDMQNGVLVEGYLLGYTNGFSVAGTGDFNGDGTSDILLQSGGTVVEWAVQNNVVTSGHVLGVAAGWAVAGTGDFNGDGTTDILLQDNGSFVVWDMRNGNVTNGFQLTSAPGWSIVGTGDFNGDGVTDILLRNGGTLVDWIMQNNAVAVGHQLATGLTGWSVAGTGDYNGDGTSDILLQNGSSVVDYTMSNGLVASGSLLSSAGSYRVIG